MNKIEKLIEKLDLHSIEIIELGEICELIGTYDYDEHMVY